MAVRDSEQGKPLTVANEDLLLAYLAAVAVVVDEGSRDCHIGSMFSAGVQLRNGWTLLKSRDESYSASSGDFRSPESMHRACWDYAIT